MDFGLRSKKNRGQDVGDLGWCDITSMMIKRRGNDRYDFGLTLRGCVVRPPDATTSTSACRTQSLDLPVSSRIEIDQDSLFEQMSGLRDIFSSAVLPTTLGHEAAYMASPEPDDQNSSQSPQSSQSSGTITNTDFDPQAMFYSETSGELGGVQDDSERAFVSLSCGMADEHGQTIGNDFSAELFGLEIALENPFVENSFESHASILDLSSSTEDGQHISPIPNTPSTFSITIDGRHHCRLCNATFKRPGDVKRHSKVHFPERNFHCREPHCKRNGKHGFYRKDKLRAHQRQVHNM